MRLKIIMATTPENTDGLPTHRERPKDRSGLVILSVVIIFVISAGVLVMGLAPEIFRQGDVIDQQAIQKHEDDARDAQAVKILTHVDDRLYDLERNITQLMMDSEKRSNVSKAQRDVLDNKLDVNNAQNTKILNSLANKSKDHEAQSIKMEILSDHISTALKNYGENSIEKFDKIIENQIEINKKLGILLNKTN